MKRSKLVRQVFAIALGIALMLSPFLPTFVGFPADASAPQTTSPAADVNGNVSAILGASATNIGGILTDLVQNGTRPKPQSPTPKFLGMPGPPQNVKSTFPNAQLENAPWYAGAAYSYLATPYMATEIGTVITTPATQPNSADAFFVAVSTFDTAPSYVQTGIVANYGTWYAFYSWTTGPPANPTYNHNNAWYPLSTNTTYSFTMVIGTGGTWFYLWQYSGGTWSVLASFQTNDGATGMYVQNNFSGYYCYTNYEEVYSTYNPSGVPEDNFVFKDNWAVISGTQYPELLFDPDISPGAPPSVVVQQSSADVIIDNSATNAHVPYVYSLSYPSSVTVGQPITIQFSAQATAGYTATEMHLQLEFPSLTAANQVTVVSSPPSGSVYGSGSIVPDLYGYGNVTTSYVLVDYYATNVLQGTTLGLAVQVTPQTPGNFTFYLASTLGFNIGNPWESAWMHEPGSLWTSDALDQKYEYVDEYAIVVTPTPTPTPTPPGGGVLPLEWLRQFGSAAGDSANAISADATGIYVAGFTLGTLPGQSSSGGSDAFVCKYDTDGNEVWTRQFGSSSDYANAVFADTTGIYVAGYTGGTFPGQSSSGGQDAFVRKYDASGNEIWTRQFGSAYDDYAYGISADSTGIYVVGYTYGTFPGQSNSGYSDAFVRKYDASGNELWTHQFGSAADDIAFGISADSSGVYVAGSTWGTLPGQSSSGVDAFVRKYDANGNEVWTRQFGSAADDIANCISVDSSGIYVAGLYSGNNEDFVYKYDASGNEIWARSFGTSSGDYVYGISACSTGIYVAGMTTGTFDGQSSLGGGDAFVVKCDASGNEIGTSQFGSDSTDYANAISADTTGIYVAGDTWGTLPSQSNSGGFDAYVAKFTSSAPTPTPTPPTVNTSAASNITASSATLNGNLTDMGTATSVTVSFEWGNTMSYGNETPAQIMTAPGAFSGNITGLDPDTIYHFRAKAVGDSTSYGNDTTFTTGTVPPTVATNAAGNITASSATLNGNLTDMGTATSLTVSFEWGNTTSYGNETPAQIMTAPGAFSGNITGLDPDTIYHFRAKAVGDSTSYGVDRVFILNGATPVTGITREVNGDILPGVTITLDGVETVVSNQSGQYEIAVSATGNHTLVVHKDGFRDRTQTINVAGLGPDFAATCNFQSASGLIPNAPDMQYALICVNRWLYPGPDTGLDILTVLAVINAWLYPVQ